MSHHGGINLDLQNDVVRSYVSTTPRPNGRRRRRQPHMFLMCLLAASTSILFDATLTSILRNTNIFCSANEDVDDGDFLAEILAEQAREDEELARMEAEVRDFEAIRARQTSDGGGGGMPEGNGGPGMGKMRGGASRTMPKGAGGGSTFSKLEDDLKKKEAENAKRKQTQEDDVASQEAERTRLRREAAFESELKKMNEEQQKKAKRQKARDAKVVKRILKAHEAGRHYATLGIRNLEFQLGPIYIFNFMIGPVTLFRTKTKGIKRAYRNLARTVHPDKNKDGRAEEAFHALETSAAILTDDKQRSDYDKRIIATRRRRNQYAMERVVGVSQVAWTRTILTLRMAKRILGPFSTPILVVGSLII
jgi:hypothetical protein